MWKPSAGLFLLGLLASVSRAANLFEYATKIPACAIPCIAELIPASNCNTFTNTTCICTDRDLYQDITHCVVEACPGLEAYNLAKVEAEACGFPIRDRKTELFAFIAVEIFTLLCVGLRICSRWRTGGWRSDDYLMVVILLVYLPFTGIGEYVRMTGFGVDMWTLRAEAITLAMKWFFIDESLYLVLFTLTKILILSLYLQIFPCPTFRIMTFILMGVVASTGMALLVAQILQCLPINYNWEGWEGNFGPHRCVNLNVLTTAAAVFAIVHDVAILLLPIKVLMNLNASPRKKAGIILMFSMGIFVTIVSCIRLRYVVKFMESSNPTWDYTDLLIWSAVEINVAVIVPCLPSIRLLFIQSSSPSISGTQDSMSRSEWKPPPPSSRPIAQKRAAARTNFPKSSLSLALSELFGARSPLSPKFALDDQARSPLSPKLASGSESLSPRFGFGSQSRSPLSPGFCFSQEKQMEMGLQPHNAAYVSLGGCYDEKISYLNGASERRISAPHSPRVNGQMNPWEIGMAQ